MGTNIFKIRISAIALFLSFTLFNMIGVKARQADSLVFAIVTDTHIGKPGNSEGLATIIDDINKRTQINFVVITGDVSDFGLMDQLTEAKKLMDRLNKSYYIIPGNHDTAWSGNGGLTFSKIFNDDKFVADFKGYRLIALNTGPYIRHSGGFVTNGQLSWLDSLIKVTPKNKPVLFFSHMPMIGDNLNNSQLVLQRLKKLNVVASFCGHGHTNKVFDYAGLKGIMTRTAQEREGTLAYNIIRVVNDSIEVKMIRPGIETDTIWARLPEQNNKAIKISNAPVPANTTNFSMAKPVWSFHDGGNILSTPAIWGQTFLAGNLKGEFKSRSLKDGKVLWNFKTRQAIYSSPAVFNNSVIFGSADSTIYCLNAQNGKLKWKMPVEGAVVSSPLIDDGKVYIGSSDLYFRCIDLLTGRLVWKSKELAGFPPGKPAIKNGKLIFGTWNKTLYALDAKNGSKAWKWVNADKSHYYSPAVSTPVIMKNKVYVVAPDEIIHVFDLQTGKEIVNVEGHRVRESFGGDTALNLVVAKTMKDSVLIWNVAGEKPQITASIFAGFGTDYSPSDVVIQNQMAFFGTTFGRLYAIDLQQNEIKWISQISNGMVNTPVVLPDHKILVTSADGNISLFDN